MIHDPNTPSPWKTHQEKVHSYSGRPKLVPILVKLMPYTEKTIAAYLNNPSKMTSRFVSWLRKAHDNRDMVLAGLTVDDRYILEDFLDHVFTDQKSSPKAKADMNPHGLAKSLGNYPVYPMNTVPDLVTYQPPPRGSDLVLSEDLLARFNHVNQVVGAFSVSSAAFLHFSRNTQASGRRYVAPLFAYHGPSYLAVKLEPGGTRSPEYAETYWSVCHALSGKGVLPGLYHKLTELLGKCWERPLRHDPVPAVEAIPSLDEFNKGPGTKIFSTGNYNAVRGQREKKRPSRPTHLEGAVGGKVISESKRPVTDFLGSKMYHWLCKATLNNPVAYLNSVSGEYGRPNPNYSTHDGLIPLYKWREVFRGERDPNIDEIIILAAVWIDSFESVATHGMTPETTINPDTLLPDLGIDLGPLLVDGGSARVLNAVWLMGAKTLVDAAVEQFTSFGIGPTPVEMAHRIYGRYLTTVICQLLGKDVSDDVKEDQALREEYLSFRPHRSIEMDAQRNKHSS